MEFLIAGLLVFNLAVTLVIAQLLERETRRQFSQVKELLAEIKAIVAGANASLGELRRGMSRLEAQSKEDEDEAKYSRSMEEGIANLLQYQVGKGRSGHDNGSDGF